MCVCVAAAALKPRVETFLCCVRFVFFSKKNQWLVKASSGDGGGGGRVEQKQKLSRRAKAEAAIGAT